MPSDVSKRTPFTHTAPCLYLLRFCALESLVVTRIASSILSVGWDQYSRTAQTELRIKVWNGVTLEEFLVMIA